MVKNHKTLFLEEDVTMKKRFMALAMAGVMAMSLAACGSSDEAAATTAATTAAPAATENHKNFCCLFLLLFIVSLYNAITIPPSAA